MKQIITTLMTAAAMMLCTLGQAQSSLVLGIGGGANLTKMKGTGDYDPGDSDISRLLRYQGGVEAGVMFGRFSILTGLRFQQRGWKRTVVRDDPNNNYWILPDGRIDVGELEERTKFNVLSVPLLLGYELGSGALRFSLALGPQFNIGMGQITTTQEFDLLTAGSINNEYTRDFGTRADENFKPMHMSFVFRPGVSYEISPQSSITVNLIMDSGGDILNRSLLVTTSDGSVRKVNGSVKTRTTALEIGYRHKINFRLGAKY